MIEMNLKGPAGVGKTQLAKSICHDLYTDSVIVDVTRFSKGLVAGIVRDAVKSTISAGKHLIVLADDIDSEVVDSARAALIEAPPRTLLIAVSN